MLLRFLNNVNKKPRKIFFEVFFIFIKTLKFGLIINFKNGLLWFEISENSLNLIGDLGSLLVYKITQIKNELLH